MKKIHKFIVFRNKKTGTFLAEYKNKENRLVYTANYCNDIQDAIILEEEYYQRQKQQLSALCEALQCEPLRVKAEYILETLDGEPAQEIEYDSKEQQKEDIQKIFDTIFGG